MSETTPALDEAFERMAAASFELPNGFVNHGAMACEALAVLDCAGDIDSWARRFARVGGVRIEPVASAGFEWRQALGSYDHLPEWIGYFARAIDDEGWAGMVRHGCRGSCRRCVPRCFTARSGPPMPCGPLTRSTPRRGARSWPGPWATGRPATIPASLPGPKPHR